MDLHEYLSATDQTARYPGAGTGSLVAFTYLGLGLSGESSEVLEKAQQRHWAGVHAEVGDVLWYIARLHRELGQPLTAPARRPGAGLDRDADAQLEKVSKLVVTAGRVAEVIKKAVRDDAQQMTPAREEMLGELMADLLGAWQHVIDAYCWVPEDVAARNIAKLLDRRDRGVLAGSGDHR